MMNWDIEVKCEDNSESYHPHGYIEHPKYTNLKVTKSVINIKDRADNFIVDTVLSFFSFLFIKGLLTAPKLIVITNERPSFDEYGNRLIEMHFCVKSKKFPSEIYMFRFWKGRVLVKRRYEDGILYFGRLENLDLIIERLIYGQR